MSAVPDNYISVKSDWKTVRIKITVKIQSKVKNNQQYNGFTTKQFL